jgi:hypothetical protein
VDKAGDETTGVKEEEEVSTTLLTAKGFGLR